VELSRISYRGWLSITLFLVGVVLFLSYLNSLYRGNQSYEGIVIEKYERSVPKPGLVLPGFNTAYFIRVRTQEGEHVRAEVYLGMYNNISVGDYVIKKKGDYYPSTVILRSSPQGRPPKKTIPHVSDIEVPMPRRNPDLSRQLETYDKSR
jgi:hypothetical protein